MKKILTVLSIVLTMFISSESLARHHHSHHCNTCGYSNVSHKYWHHKHGWWLPVGMLAGSLALTTSQYYERQRIYSTPSEFYFVPNYGYTYAPYHTPRTIIYQDRTNPRIIYYEDF